jgi:hypothetical protein
MFSFFPKGVSVVTLVVLGTDGNGKVVPVRKFRLANSRHDLARFPLRADGTPVIGPRVYRERTKAEIKADGLSGADYLATLVPLSNTGEPWLKAEALRPAA